MAVPRVLSPEDHRKHRELYTAFVAASSRALEVLATHGMESSEFMAADKEAGMIADQINKLLGRSHWMA